MPNQVFTQNHRRVRQPVALIRDARVERQNALKQTVAWLAAGTAIVALSFAFSQKAHAQAAPVDPYASDLETYSCSPNSQALLSQVQLMKAAGSQLRERWAEQGFGIGNHMPDTGAHVFAGAQPSVMASAYGTHSATVQSADYGQSAANGGTGGNVGSVPSVPRNVSYGSLFNADDGSTATGAQQATSPSPARQSSAANLAPAPVLNLPGNLGSQPMAQAGNNALAAAQPMPTQPMQTSMPGSVPVSTAAPPSIRSSFHDGLMAGDPQAVRQGLNAAMNNVDPVRPDYQRFFQAHPSMQEHLQQAQAMGIGPGPVVIDPNAVAKQFGLEYSGQMVDPYSFIPPDTGSALSRLALRFRSLFYSR